MILRRTDEGALKCALRALRREEETSVSDDEYLASPVEVTRGSNLRGTLPIQHVIQQETATSYRERMDMITA